MKVPLSWLKEYLPINLSIDEIDKMLTMLGLEVESVEKSETGESIFEIALTPNLAHCASIRGIARELSAITQEALLHPKHSLIENSDLPIEKRTSVTVEDPENCPRYACRLIENVQVAPSPDWLRERVEMCGMQSVNNVVDITNLVMLELGHPLHAFDFDRLEGGRIVVRSAKQGENIVVIDQKEYFPSPQTLVICDGDHPIAIAGVMGSAHTEVNDSTTTVLLEAAYFEPRSIRRTSKRLGLQTEASYRFERGVDPNGVVEALDRATGWINEVAGGVSLQGLIDCKAQESFIPKEVTCRLVRINQLLGIRLAMSEAETMLQRLGFLVLNSQEEHITVASPTARHDIHEEIDLIEEIARLYGYNNLRKREKPLFRASTLDHSPIYLFEQEIRHRLIGEGLQEFISCNLISPEEASWVTSDKMPSRALIKLLNPSSIDQSVMRPSLLPGMLRLTQYNVAHEMADIAGFEIGRAHFKSKERYLEPTLVSIVLSGNRRPRHWETKPQPVDFFSLKGIIENLLSFLHISPATFNPSNYQNFHPGRQAAIIVNEMELGTMGEIHPLMLEKTNLSNPVYFAELNLEDLLSLTAKEIKMCPLPQYPSSTRDTTLTLLETEPVATLFEAITACESTLLEKVELADIYRSDTLGPDKKNITLHFAYRDLTKTISMTEVEAEHQRIIDSINMRLQP